jgi:hypothetical protein
VWVAAGGNEILVDDDVLINDALKSFCLVEKNIFCVFDKLNLGCFHDLEIKFSLTAGF